MARGGKGWAARIEAPGPIENHMAAVAFLEDDIAKLGDAERERVVVVVLEQVVVE